MNKKVVGIFILIALIILTPVLFSFFNPSVDARSPVLENCETLKYGQEGAVDLVFFGSKKLAEEYIDFFLETSPFDENQDKFNFYHIADYTPTCELYKGIAILCYSKKLIKKAASCPNDHIIVLQEKPSTIRSSAYMKVLSINTNHPKTVLTHEFGHSYANLAEEYLPAKIPKGSENCASECSEFGESDGCFEGCSDSTHLRSIENGVMRTLSSNNYGLFNERIILEKLSKISSTTSITTSAILNQDCITKEYYLISGTYHENGQITIEETTIEDGCSGDNGEGIFSYELEKKDGTTIPGTTFNPGLLFTDGIDEGGTYPYGEFTLTTPLISNSKSLSIFEYEVEIYERDLEGVGVSACHI